MFWKPKKTKKKWEARVWSSLRACPSHPAMHEIRVLVTQQYWRLWKQKSWSRATFTFPIWIGKWFVKIISVTQPGIFLGNGELRWNFFFILQLLNYLYFPTKFYTIFASLGGGTLTSPPVIAQVNNFKIGRVIISSNETFKNISLLIKVSVFLSVCPRFSRKLLKIANWIFLK